VLAALFLEMQACVPQVTLRSDGNDAAQDVSGRDADASPAPESTSATGAGGASEASPGAGGASEASPEEDGYAMETGLVDAAGDDRSDPPMCDEGHPDACPAPVCPGASGYDGDFDRRNSTSTVVTDVSIPNIQNLLVGAASDGGTILIHRICGSDGSLWLYDGDFATRTYTGVEITNNLPGFDLSEAHITLAPDGMTVVSTLSPFHLLGFQAKRRRDRHSTEFVNAEAISFVHVNDWAMKNASLVWGPILSADGLSFFFMAQLTGDPAEKHYEVTRTRPDDSFSPPDQPIPGLSVGQGDMCGVSPDRLTLFAAKAGTYITTMLVRPRLDAPFAPIDPPIGMYRTVPLGNGCSQLIGNGGVAGCPTEELFVLSAR
jgi:hypothetical protein